MAQVTDLTNEMLKKADFSQFFDSWSLETLKKKDTRGDGHKKKKKQNIKICSADQLIGSQSS